MKHKRKHILKQIGIGIEEARINRLRLTMKIVHAEIPVRTLKAVQIVLPEFLEESKKKIAYDIATALYNNNFIWWEIDDEPDPILRGQVKIVGTLRVAKPERDGGTEE